MRVTCFFLMSKKNAITFGIKKNQKLTSMKKTSTLILILFLCYQLHAQQTFRNAMFLHHSTGSNILGPNSSSTSVNLELIKYNETKLFTGDQKVTMNHEWFAPGDNEWVTMRNFFEGKLSLKPDNYYNKYKIIIVKSCFPSSSIVSEGSASDMQTPTYKSIYNYKWHWRSMVRIMEQHPDNFFVIWTNAPLVATTPTEAANSKSFCHWAKNILAKGLDAEYGQFPKNVYVFDFFAKLTGEDGIMKIEYATSSGDSHPNAAATELVAPQFVQEIFDAALDYERIITSVPHTTTERLKIFPLPAKDHLTVEIEDAAHPTTIALTNICGQEVLRTTIAAAQGRQRVNIDVSTLPRGIFIIHLQAGDKAEARRVLIQ